MHQILAHGLQDSPASPFSSTALCRRHSPWTATRLRKKGRQENDALLPEFTTNCIEEEETQTGSSSRDCDAMILDLQQMTMGERSCCASKRASEDSHDAAGLFMPAGFSMKTGSPPKDPARSVNMSSREFEGMHTALSLDEYHLHVSPRCKSTSDLPSGRAEPWGIKLVPGVNVTTVFSDDTPLIKMSEDLRGSSWEPSGSGGGDDQRKSMKRRSIDTQHYSLSRATSLPSNVSTATLSHYNNVIPASSPTPGNIKCNILRPPRRGRPSATKSGCGSILPPSGPIDLSGQLNLLFRSQSSSPQLSPSSQLAEDSALKCVNASEGPSTLGFSPLRPLTRSGSEGEYSLCTVVKADEEVEGFRISTVLTGTELELEGSSDKLARRDQHLRASREVAAETPLKPVTLSSSVRSNWTSTVCHGEVWNPDSGELDEARGRWMRRGFENDGLSDSPDIGFAIRTLHSEEDFQTPVHSPESKSISTAARELLASRRIARRKAIGHCEHLYEDDSDPEGSGFRIPVEQLGTLDDFNIHLQRAASYGNRGRADCLFAELCMRGLNPNTKTLNVMLRCMANSVARPDEAENLARDICLAGNLSPDSETYQLLAETRYRYEQLCEGA